MAAIEVLTFQLADGAEEAAFREANRRVQTEFFPHQPGALRRTTARGGDGQWAVVALWRSEQEADAAAAVYENHPATSELRALVDSGTRQRKLYSTLD